jgi:hypothetical protein
MKRLAAALASLALTASGCTYITSGFGFRDMIVFQDQAIANRNKNEAYKAWKRAKWDYWRQGVPHYLREHIGRGFQQGFADVAGGSSGELPLFPPNTYWGPGYQNPKGNEMIAAWFRGYSDGAMAGEQSGLPRYVTLPTSSAVPMPKGETTTEVHADPSTSMDFLPPELKNQMEAVPAVPAVPPVPPVPATEPKPLPLPNVTPNAPVPPAPKTAEPAVQGKQTSTEEPSSKPVVAVAVPIAEATDEP